MTQSISPEDKIEATDNPDLAKQHGLTQFDEQRGQYVAPTGPAEHGNREGDGTRDEQNAGTEQAADLNAKDRKSVV